MIGHMLDRKNQYTYNKCIILFSLHALQRMSERNISQQNVLDLLCLEETVLVAPSDRDDSIDLCLGQVNGKYWLVIINRITKIVVTERPMREKEIEQYKDYIK